ncbi:MAG: autotransporter-associated beta strand repeat-containing protein, partial [Rhodocyclaceae bacterium]|nr:autotransporter-associated beta strand repeat-containing protein [Rhodocyclaceae bacterium]
MGASTLTTGDANDTSFDGVISGTGGLVKQGAGTFTLNGANTLTGATTVGGGTLALAGASGAISTGAVSVASGARLHLDNTLAFNNNRMAGALTLNGGEFAV